MCKFLKSFNFHLHLFIGYLLYYTPCAYSDIWKGENVENINNRRQKVLQFDHKIRFETQMYGLNVNSPMNETQAMGVAFLGGVHAEFSKQLQFIFQGGLYLETGAQKSTLLNEYAPEKDLLLYEARGIYRPFKSLTLEGGAINQSYLDSPLFLDKLAFLGTRQKLEFNLWANSNVVLDFTQLVPDNKTMVNRIGSIKEGTPKLFIERIALSQKIYKSQLEFYGLYFSYRDVSEGIAEQSRLMGNTVKGIGEDSYFSYQYEGIGLGTRIKQEFGNWSGVLGLDYIRNNYAPINRDESIRTFIGASYKHIVLQLGTFRNESDASIAYYNDKDYGHSGMKGKFGTLSYLIPYSELSLKLDYYTATPLENALERSKQDVTFISISRKYEL